MFKSALDEASQAPEITSAGSGRRSVAELKSVADRWRRAVERRTEPEEAAYQRAVAEERELALRKARYQHANAILLILASLLIFLLALVDSLLWATTSPILALGVLAVVAVMVVLMFPRSTEDRQGLAALRTALRVPGWSTKDEDRLASAGRAVTATHTTWKRSLRDAILARLLVYQAAPTFSDRLPSLPQRRLPAGLRESLDTSFHVPTRTGARLARLMRDLRGGSFALVGARGTGKTDLLGALTLGAYDDEGAVPLLTVQISAPTSYVSRDFVLQLFVQTCGTTVAFVDRCLAEPDLEPAVRLDLRALRTRAQDERQALLHQATTSVEAAATGGVGPLTIGVRRGASQSRLASSYPGVVSELRAFLEYLESVLDRYAHRQDTSVGPDERGVEVVIAIDELDRMEGPDQARAFLHEVKGVFGVRNCCFIVAMAEETLDAFDNAGKPIYDVLDRVFDEVVHMEYLDLATSASLLASRVSPPFPHQYVGLCYCLSGGVPRNVIRTARGIVGISLRDGCDRLSAITAAMVDEEIEDLAEWARERLARIGGSNVVEAVGTLYDLARRPRPGHDLRMLLTDLERVASEPQEAIEIASVRERTWSTASFLRTILDVFDDALDEQRYERGRHGEPAGSFESLARVRRWLGINDHLAVAMLQAFRGAWHLEDPPRRG